MKNSIKILSLAAMLAAVFSFDSCNKQAPEANVNPAVSELPASPFQLSAMETRAGHVYPWTISKDGVTESLLEEGNKDLVVTLYNEVSVSVTPDNSGTYAGVNVKSSNPNAVCVEILNANTFILKRPSIGADGNDATIEVWNGSGSVEHKIAFKVRGEQIIHPESFRLIVDGQQLDVKLYSRPEEAAASPSKLLSIPDAEKTKEFDTTGPHEVIFDGVLPRNCEYDAIAYQVGHNPLWMEYLFVKGFDTASWLKWNNPKDPDKYKPLFPGANDFSGKLDDLDDNRLVYVACHPDAMSLASQFVKQTVSVSMSGVPAYTWYATIYVEYPFASQEELDEWLSTAE